MNFINVAAGMSESILIPILGVGIIIAGIAMVIIKKRNDSDDE